MSAGSPPDLDLTHSGKESEAVKSLTRDLGLSTLTTRDQRNQTGDGLKGKSWTHCIFSWMNIFYVDTISLTYSSDSVNDSNIRCLRRLIAKNDITI